MAPLLGEHREKKKIYTALVSYILYYPATSKHSLKLDMIKSDLFI